MQKTTAFSTECHIYPEFYRENSQNPTMANLVVAGLQDLLFVSYEQFISHLCNVFKVSSVHRSLWNGTHAGKPEYAAFLRLYLGLSAHVH